MTEHSQASRIPVDRPIAIALLAMCGAVPVAMYLVLPSFVNALHNIPLALTEWRIGLLASADLAGTALITASGVRWVRRVEWRRFICTALGAYLLCNVICMVTEQFWPLLLLRLCAGLSGGAAFVIALAGISDTKNPARVAALMVSAQIIVGAVGIYALPYIQVGPPNNSVYLYIIIWTVPLTALCWRFFPDNAGSRPALAQLPADNNRWARIAVIVATLCFAVCVGAVWAELETMAMSFGLPARDVSNAISVGFIASLLGSGLAAWQGLRFGRVLPLIVGLILQSGTLIAMANLPVFSNPNSAFFVASSLFQIVWCYVLSYQIVIYNDVDPTGRFIASYGTTFYGGMALGPFAGGMLIAGGGYSLLMNAGLVVMIVSYGVYLITVYACRTGRAHESRG